MGIMGQQTIVIYGIKKEFEGQFVESSVLGGFSSINAMIQQNQVGLKRIWKGGILFLFSNYTVKLWSPMEENGTQENYEGHV